MVGLEPETLFPRFILLQAYSLLNPMIARAPEPHFFVGHVVYGVVTALALGIMVRRVPTPMGRESLP